MTKRIYSLTFAVLFLAQVACGQMPKGKAVAGPPAPTPTTFSTPEIDRAKLKTQAEEIGRAFISGDFEKVADLTYPGIVQMAGGRAQIVAFLKKSMKEMRAGGFDIVSVSVDEPTQVIKVDKRLFAVVPTTMRVKVPQGTFVGPSFYIGVSDDGGEKWTFVDGNGGANKQKLRALFPSAADKLELPQERPPVLDTGKPNV
ncbi:MAG: hypothetical protein LC754_09275 [Acidobacteria bacterium]|nr:hypothetical protein [Acidobacteriota bacterium]